MKKSLTVIMAGVFLSGGILFGSNAKADENLKPYGGWSESEGYFSSQPLQDLDSGSYTLFAATKPDSHEGKRLSRMVNNQGDFEYAARGITIWEGKYHYTTARMENSKGTVLTTSLREWGFDYTIATSPYYAPQLYENTEARTYWGY